MSLTGTAHADGYCGADRDGPTACPISANGTVTGSIAPETAFSQETDFFVFYARPGTSVSLTVNDTEPPSCSIDLAANAPCGEAYAQLFDARGNQITDDLESNPSNGIPVPTSASARLAGGTYYVEAHAYSMAEPVTYTITVDGSPGVQWPAPCRVPILRHPVLLSTAKHRLSAAHCAVGRIVHRVVRHVPHGDAYALHPGGGTYLAAGAPVEVIVSGTRPRRHRRHRR